MLTHTFLHIPGIGSGTERRFWDSGIHSWEDFIGGDPSRISRRRPDAIAEYLNESRRHVESGDPTFFSNLMPPRHHWRLFPEFRNVTAYLDIETTGLDSRQNEITTVALYDGHSVKTYVNGRNLEDFIDDMRKYKLIVTYNGKCFDVPFIERFFGIRMNQAHIDLRYILGSLGYRGGLKRCEVQLGIDRGVLTDIDGFFAVLLWYDYQRNGNQKALDTLLAYNVQDVLTLEELMVVSYNLNIRNTPFYTLLELPAPVLPRIPFEVDARTVERIKNSMRLYP